MLEAKVFEAAPSSHRRVHGEHRSFVPPHPTMANGTAPHHEAHEAHKAGRCRGAPPTATARRHYVHPRRLRRSTKYGDVGSHRPTIAEARHLTTKLTKPTKQAVAGVPHPQPRRDGTTYIHEGHEGARSTATWGPTAPPLKRHGIRTWRHEAHEERFFRGQPPRPRQRHGGHPPLDSAAVSVFCYAEPGWTAWKDGILTGPFPSPKTPHRILAAKHSRSSRLVSGPV